MSPKKLPSNATGCAGLSKLFIEHIYAGYDYPMTSIRSSMCTGTKCKPAPFASKEAAGFDYKNMSKAWYLTAAVSGMRTMQNAQSYSKLEESSPVDSGYLKTMLSDGPRFDNGYFKAMVNAGVSEKPCRLLCESSSFPWEKKCTWGLTCSGCSQCDESPQVQVALSRAADGSDCDAAKFLQPHALAVQQFAKDEKAWLQAFMEAWWIGTTNAQAGLSFLMPPTGVPAKAAKCVRLRKKDVCAHLGCAWNGTLCSGGVELSWGVKWNELHMLVPRAQPAPKTKRAKRAERKAGAAGIVPDWQPPMSPRSIFWPPPPPKPQGFDSDPDVVPELCSSPLVNRVTHGSHSVGEWGGLCTCGDGGSAWVGDVAPCEGNSSITGDKNSSHDHRDPEPGAACVGGTVSKHHKSIGEWSHTLMQCGVCMDACDEPVPRQDVYNEKDMTVGSWGGRCLCPSGNVFKVGVKEDGYGACKNGVFDMYMEHGGPWSHKSVVCHPCPAPGWVFTGSWGPGLPGEDYTEGWGAANSTAEKGFIPFPVSRHPEHYSINGSNNGLVTGRLTVLSGETWGWTQITFSGAAVQGVEILDGVKGVTLSGDWNHVSQIWTVDTPKCPDLPSQTRREELLACPVDGHPDALTINVSWTVIIHVVENPITGGHAEWGDNDDVDAHFECVGCVVSPPSPPPPAPTPPPHPKPPPPPRPPPPPQPCSDTCVDVQPDHSLFRLKTCADQLLHGKCEERREAADGLCEATCGICIPCPRPDWNFTGSWGPGLPGEDYTEGWGSPNSTKGFPPSKHPEFYSVIGSGNHANKGHLTVLSGDTIGWTSITFSGAHVLDVRITGPTGETLKGKWDAGSQKWKLKKHAKPDELTVGVSWTVGITVKEGSATWGDADDVDAHFECNGCTPSPPPAPPSPSPPPHSPPPNPAPIEPWCFTGTWGDGEFTKFWGPPWGEHRNPPAKNGTLPEAYSIEGSCNHGTVGEQTVLSGAKEGWNLIHFTGLKHKGARVLSVEIRAPTKCPHLPSVRNSTGKYYLDNAQQLRACPPGEPLLGTFNAADQTWKLKAPVKHTPKDGLTVGAAWVVAVTVKAGTTDDVDAHYSCEDCVRSPPAPPPAPRPTYWLYTGSWGDEQYTKDFGPPWGESPNPVSKHPQTYSITGSLNTGALGALNILSGKKIGWTLIGFTGAKVLSVNVTNADGDVLPGDWDVDMQTFNVSNWCPMDPHKGEGPPHKVKNLAAPANGKRAGGKGGRDGKHKRYFVDEDGVRWEADATNGVPPARHKKEIEKARKKKVQEVPTSAPTSAPTAAPTAAPTSAPTAAPTSAPTSDPASADRRWFDAPYRSTRDEEPNLPELKQHAKTAKERHAERVAKEQARHPKQHKRHANLTKQLPVKEGEAAVLPFFVDEDGVRWEPGPQNMEPSDGLLTATHGPPAHHKTRVEAEAEMEAEAAWKMEQSEKMAREKGDLTSGLTSQLTREPNLALKKRDLTHNNYRRSIRRSQYEAKHPTRTQPGPDEEDEEPPQSDPDGTFDHSWAPAGDYDGEFGPTFQEQTIGVEWIVTVTLQEGNAEDVNANFTWAQCECHPHAPPPAPAPPGEDWDHSAPNEHDDGGAARPHRIKPPHPPPLPPAAPPPCKSECSATCAPDVQPPKHWEFSTCAEQAANGKCMERFNAKDGYCEQTCKICFLCAPPPPPPPAPCGAKSGKCSDSCTDVEPPSQWDISTCAGQLSSGKCPERWSLNDGYCEATCGICVACDAPPVEPLTMAPTMAPTRVLFSSLPPPAPSLLPCSPLCGDVQPPSHWGFNTCAEQKANGKCLERASAADGFCELTCAVCMACELPTSAPTMAPTVRRLPEPTPCANGCADVQPPVGWSSPTCASQLAAGKCPERASLADGLCEWTCGICNCLEPPQEEEPCPEEPTAAPTAAPTMAPTKAPCKKPAECSDSCVDVPPPSNWKEPTCAEQLAEGKCPERFSMADGYCEATCGICVACSPVEPAKVEPPKIEPPCSVSCEDVEPPADPHNPMSCADHLKKGTCVGLADGLCEQTCAVCTACPEGDIVHGDPIFKHNGVGLKFTMPIAKVVDLLAWHGAAGERAVLRGTAFERASTGDSWFDSLALTVSGKEVFNVSIAKVARGTLRMVVDGKLVNPSDVDRFTSVDKSTTLASAMLFGNRYKIGHKSGQMLSFKTVGDAALTIFTAKAAKYKDSEEAQFRYRHLNVKLDSGVPLGATGVFAELSGAAPLKASTKRMLADPSAFDRAMSREQTEATEPSAESAEGAEGAEAESVAPSPKGFFEAEGEGESFLAPKSFLPKKLLGPKLKSLQSVEISAGVDRPGYDAA